MYALIAIRIEGSTILKYNKRMDLLTLWKNLPSASPELCTALRLELIILHLIPLAVDAMHWQWPVQFIYSLRFCSQHTIILLELPFYFSCAKNWFFCYCTEASLAYTTHTQHNVNKYLHFYLKIWFETTVVTIWLFWRPWSMQSLLYIRYIYIYICCCCRGSLFAIYGPIQANLYCTRLSAFYLSPVLSLCGCVYASYNQPSQLGLSTTKTTTNAYDAILHIKRKKI